MTADALLDEALAAGFLRAVHGAALDGKRVVSLFTTPGRRTAFFTDPADAARVAMLLAPSKNVYVCCCPLAGQPAKGRGKAAAAGAMTALWIDLDVAGPCHKKQNLPPTAEDARDLLAELPVPPSIVVDSGHGIQGWWVFKEPLAFEAPADRTRADRLIEGWQQVIQIAAGRHGWTVDATHSLAQVLRVPGTLNRKAEPVPVRVLVPAALDGDVRRFNPCDFESFLPDEPLVPPGPARPAEADPPAAAPTEAALPAEKLAALLLNDPRFKRTWTRQRADLPSQSEHDLALANVAVRAGWADAEIGALIVAHRRAGGEDVAKARRHDYICGLIAKARASLRDGEQARAALDALAEAAREPGAGPLDDGRRAALLAAAGKALGIEMVSFEQFGRDAATATFALVLVGGRRVGLGTATDVLSQGRVRAAVFAEIGRAIRPLKAAAWADLCTTLGCIRALVENPAGERADETLEWLRQYFLRVHVHDEQADAVPCNAPFTRGGLLHVHALSLMRFIRMDLCQSQVDRADLWGRLHEAGFSPVVVSTRVVGAGVVARRYWSGLDVREQARGEPKDLGGLFTDPASRV